MLFKRELRSNVFPNNNLESRSIVPDSPLGDVLEVWTKRATASHTSNAERGRQDLNLQFSSWLYSRLTGWEWFYNGTNDRPKP